MSFLHNFLGGLLKPVLTYASRSRLPQTNGRLQVPGLVTPVTVYRDPWGIPHLYGESRRDICFAQGYVHAGERLFQMEVNRRTAGGRLSELFGETALETDRLTRTLGFRRLAESAWRVTSAEVQAEVEAYAAGVNAFISREGKRPIEFSLLRYQPEPWEPLDTLAFAMLQAWALSNGSNIELVRLQLNEILPAELQAEIEPIYPAGNPATLPHGIEFNRLLPDARLEATQGPFLGKGTLDGAGRGSNGWVISAARSATGHAILCNDMHLPLSTPGLWFYTHQESADGLHVAGVTIPGAPYVLVGHNAHVAWGITLSYVDTEDFFIEQLDETGKQYRFEDAWHPMEIIEEIIQVKGRPDQVEHVRLTHHGPLVSPVLDLQLEHQSALALQAVSLQPHRALEGFRQLGAAHGWDEFIEGARLITAPSLNLVYADTSDNIGYWVTGQPPIRQQGDGLTPVPGWTGEYEWRGYIPFEEMPHAFNPARGFLITCNNRIVDDDYPYYLGSIWMNGYRARRLEELLAGSEQVSLSDCEAFQFDVDCTPGREIVQLLAKLPVDEPDARLSLDLLRAWDGQLDPDSVGGTVYKVLMLRLANVILGNGLGQEMALKVLGVGEHPLLLPTNEFFGYWPVMCTHILQNPASPWLPAQLGREATLVRCLAETTQELRRHLGDRPALWQWGKLHTVPFPHLLGAQPVLDRVFSQGPVPIGGDTDTVLQTAIRPEAPYQNNNFSPTYRQVVDMGNLSNSRAMHAPGQSGHLGSPHYGDFIQAWQTRDYYPMLWTRDEVAASCRFKLVLVPEE